MRAPGGMMISDHTHLHIWHREGRLLMRSCLTCDDSRAMGILSSKSRGMPKLIQAKYVSEGAILATLFSFSPRPVMIWDLTSMFDGIELPERVVLAKMRAMLRRGLVDGCACGCGGSFTITGLGNAELERWKPVMEVHA